VADVAEERRLGAIDLGQRLRTLALLLVRARAGQPDGNLFGDAPDELTVYVVDFLRWNVNIWWVSVLIGWPSA
jgi:hypothetical protein